MTKAIAITAHHDDSVLWCGGTIQRTIRLGWEWTVVALCVPDRPRQQYFDAYCKDANVVGQHFSFADYQLGPAFSNNDPTSMKSAIHGILDATAFDFIFTHSRDPGGEYGGHANHDEVLRATQELVPDDQLICFSYSPEFGINGTSTTARRDADYHLQLTYDELIHKAGWCQSAPDVDTSLRALGFPCPNPEGFRTKRQLASPFVPGR